MTSDHYRLLTLAARLVTAVLVAVCVWALTPTGARAAGVPVPTTNTARLVACSTGATAATRVVIVRATMAARPGARRMAMRFGLLRTVPPVAAPEAMAPAAARPVLLAVPAWDAWTRAAPGKRAFVVMRRIDGLTGPAVYTVRVTMRWLDRRGRPLRTRTIDAAPCSQPDPRPVLELTGAAWTAGPAVVATIANRGASASASGTVTVLAGAGAPPVRLGEAVLAPVAAGGTTQVVIPVVAGCAPGDIVKLVIGSAGAAGTGESVRVLGCPQAG